MKRLPVIALDAVRPDVQAAYDYFEARAPGAGDRFLDRNFEVANQIAQKAETFPVKFDDYRRALILRSYLAVDDFIRRWN